MQRDFDLVVTLLGALRDAPSPSLSAKQIAQELDGAMGTSFSEDLVRHHLDILADAELIKPAGDGGSWRLTWKGHDALEQEEDDEDED